MVQGTDGNLYGTTIDGGTGGPGTIFQITLGGAFKNLYQFCTNFDCTDGVGPSAGVIQATNGTFYGTTNSGGSTWTERSPGDGVIFSLAMNLGPFVAATPNLGKVGRVVQIFGNSLAGTTSVTFNGTSAVFKVISDTDIKAEIPTGATSGTIQVTTPSGLLSSNAPFEVAP